MKALDRLLEEVIHALGEAPLVVTADKGFAYAECARLCAELGAFGKDYANMPHRPGIGWARLRGEVSLLVNWFRLGLRLGAITGHDRIHNPKIQLRRAHDRMMRALRYREASGIDLPYGKAAERLGLALPQRPPPQPAAG
jgi:hypothetical protein